MKKEINSFVLYLYPIFDPMMKKLLLFFLLISSMAFAQTTKQLWKGYFSYNEVNDLTESPTKITASTQKAMFSKNLNTNELKTINTIDGLSGQDITAIYYSQEYNKTIIGHANGLMLILNESDGRILIVPGIRDQAGITPNKKKINHFYEFEGKLYISCDFGVVQYNLITSGFGDTYLIGPSGEEAIVYQTTIYNNYIYAVTQLNGIRRANLTNANLNDFSQWQIFDGGYWSGIVTHSNQMVMLNTNAIVYKNNGTSFQQVVSLPESGIDIRSYQNKLIVTTLHHVYVYDEDFVQLSHVISTQIPTFTDVFKCATIINNVLYIGTKENGIIAAPISNTSNFQTIKPDGPSSNDIFAIQTTPSNKLWALYGSYDIFYVPSQTLRGISKFTDTGWLNIPKEKVLGAESLVRIAVNPSDENQVYFSSFHSGLLKFQNDEAVALYNHTTQNGPEALDYPEDPSYKSVRINGLAFDKTGSLWFNNSVVENALKVLRPNGTWQSNSIKDFVDNTNDNYGRLAIDKNGTKWFVSSRNNVIGFNENVTPKFKTAYSDDDLGNPLPANTRAIAIDNRNQLWIGTMGGLRVLASVDRFMSEERLETNPIIIMDDGLPQELLYEQFITDIVVDGANNKWIGTADAGVFMLSPNGQETIYRFTRENSPLPSNSINDIDINGTTGEVFFATTAGLVSFKGTATKGNEDLSNVYVYPNPVRPEFFGTVKISNLINKANVKITDIEGNLVYEATSEGGTLEWDTKAFGKHRVASGVYMIFISSEDGTETKVKKVMIIR